jgi:DNA-binding transcriptional MerR regulator
MSEKSADALRTIGEIAKALGVRTHILRYWEEQFPMLRPLTRAGGRRLYRPEDVALLHTINRLVYTEGYTIKGARKFLMTGSAPESALEVSTSPATTPSPLNIYWPDLHAIRNRLSAALDDALGI